MNDKADEQLAGLSPREQRALLAQLLEEKSRDSKRAPLSFAQERMWFLAQLDIDNAVFNIFDALRLSGPLDVATLECCFNEVIRRHESLRTTFSTLNGQAVQIIAPISTLSLPVVDLYRSSEDEQEAEVRRLAAEEAQRPFDLMRGPLMRATLLKLSAEEHVLFLNAHHIVSDGWSRGIFVQEMATLYKAFAARQPSPFPELSIQYADFSRWQRNWLQGEVLETHLDYWRQQLAGPLTILELATDHSHATDAVPRATSQTWALGKSMSEALKALSRRQGVTLFAVMLTAFKVLLHRLTGQTDIIVGAPIADRGRAELEGMIGLFLNTLVLRTDLSGDPTFLELLDRVRQVVREAFAHKDLPFERLVKELRPKRDLDRNPLFQAVFIEQNVPALSLELPGLRVSLLPADSRLEEAPDLLGLGIQETEQGIVCALEYRADLLNQKILGHLRTLLENVVANPHQHLSALPILTKAEQHQIVVAWNATATRYPQEQCIHELFEAQVERAADRVAVVLTPDLTSASRTESLAPVGAIAGGPTTESASAAQRTGTGEDQHVTYRELNRRANQLAHHLQRLGVGPEVLVGICMERSAEMIVGLLGVLKAGGAYLPLDPAYPRERMAFMLQDGSVPVLLTQERLLHNLPAQGARVICLDTDWDEITQESETNPTSKVGADNTAYVIYTSGSTGVPKGAIGWHRPVVNLIDWVNQTFQVGPSDRVLFVTSLCFDLSVYDIFGLLAAGGSIQVPPESDARDPEQLLRLLCQRPVTFWDSAPAALQQLVPFFSSISAAWRTDQLRLIFLSGDWIPMTLPDAMRTTFTQAQITSLGGATEATVWSNYYPIGEVDPRWVSIPYGKPIQNAQYYILDPRLNPCPIGVPGDLYIGGECLVLGYANRPDLTAKKFIPDPFSDEPGGRLYSTGDRACFWPDGNIEFLGRVDLQVKIRGFRIELGEIETVLGQHSTVRETVVLAREDEPGDKRLVAYVVPNDGQEPTVDELRRFLHEKLPEYMLPSAFVSLEALPLTSNGKVDRRALPAPDVSQQLERLKAFIAPQTPLEERLADIWAQALRVEQVGIYDDFFELGGHSLMAIQLIDRINKAFRMNLPVRRLFSQEPNIANLALLIEETLIEKLEQRARKEPSEAKEPADGANA